jgi:hypothetical protein
MTQPSISVFPLVVGVLAIVLAVWHRQAQRLLGIKPAEALFTNPRFQRSARVTGVLSRVFLLLVGLGFLIQAAGPRFLSVEVTYSITLVVVSLIGMLVVAMVGVTLVHWKG